MSTIMEAFGQVLVHTGSQQANTFFMRGIDNSGLMYRGISAVGSIIFSLARSGKIPSTTIGINPKSFFEKEGQPITVTVHGQGITPMPTLAPQGLGAENRTHIPIGDFRRQEGYGQMGFGSAGLSQPGRSSGW